MTKKFKEFILRKILKPEDYIVGYDGLTGDGVLARFEKGRYYVGSNRR